MNKRILITGSTDGIGRLAAKELALEGHELWLHGRNKEKLETVIEELKKETGNDAIDGFMADFSDLTTVRQMADQVRERLDRLDVLVNNAGVFKAPISKLSNGWDIRFVVNYLTPVLLSHHLFPLLKQSEEARLINLSSAAQSPVSIQALQGHMELSEQEAYAQSKLALLMWSFYLAKKEQGLSVIALNPGSLLNTNMVKEAYGTFWSSADKGAAIIKELAVSAKHAGVTGQYFDNDKGDYGQAHSDAYQSETVEHLVNSSYSILREQGFAVS